MPAERVDGTTTARDSLGVELGRAIRKARGELTQDELGQLLNVDQPTVSKWERGQSRPSLEDLRRIEEVGGRRRGFILIAAGLVDDVQTVLDAIDADPDLTPTAREMLRAAYEVGVRQDEP